MQQMQMAGGLRGSPNHGMSSHGVVNHGPPMHGFMSPPSMMGNGMSRLMSPQPHQMQPAPQQMQSPPQRMQPPPQQMQSVPQQMQPAPQQMQTPPQQMEPPQQPNAIVPTPPQQQRPPSTPAQQRVGSIPMGSRSLECPRPLPHFMEVTIGEIEGAPIKTHAANFTIDFRIEDREVEFQLALSEGNDDCLSMKSVSIYIGPLDSIPMSQSNNIPDSASFPFQYSESSSLMTTGSIRETFTHVFGTQFCDSNDEIVSLVHYEFENVCNFDEEQPIVELYDGYQEVYDGGYHEISDGYACGSYGDDECIQFEDSADVFYQKIDMTCITDICDDPPIITSTPATSSGDPHFKTWSGKKFDYHGECDLVLVDNPSFANGLGLKLHIRTTRRKYFSYIEWAALQIGLDVLEFSNSVDSFLINGALPEENHGLLQLSGYEVRVYEKHRAVSVRLDDKIKAKIDFHEHKNGFIGVVVDGSTSDMFKGSLGLLGEWGSGKMLGRDGVSDFSNSTDTHAYALEWQVRENEPMLFQTSRAPQYPAQRCIPPKKMMLGARLGNSHMKVKAKQVCASWKEEDQDECIFDVINTRDISVAENRLMEEMDIAVA